MQESPTLSDQPRRRRWLIALALLLALFQAGAVWQALTVPADLADQVSITRPFEVIASTAWAIGFALAAWALLRRHPKGGIFLAWSIIGFAVYSLGRLAVFARADYDRLRLPFLVVATIVVVMVPVAYLNRFHSTEKLKQHGRKSEN